MTYSNQKQSEWNNYRDPSMPPPLAKAFPSAKLTPAPSASKPPAPAKGKGKGKKI